MSDQRDIYYYDSIGIRPFVRYSTATGKWIIECYRKKTKKESRGDGDWEMKREGYISSFWTRKEAEEAALKFAEQIRKDFNITSNESWTQSK